MSSKRQMGLRTNWAGNFTYSTHELHRVSTVAEAQEVVRSSPRIQALGSRHCFNAIADNSDKQISLQRLNRILQLDESSQRVTVEAGVRYGDLCPLLNERGYALHNMASLPHINIVGACATATHGSGVTNGNLATAVTAMEFIRADGELVTLSSDAGDMAFAGAVVGLGALGVVTQLTLEVQPTFNMRQHVYLDLPLTELDEHFDEIVSSAYSVSLFTDWRSDAINQVWIKRKAVTDDLVEVDPRFFGARLASSDRHPIPGHAAANCTRQMGKPGPWFERLPHFRMEFNPSSGKELQSEYFVPRETSIDVVRTLYDIGDQIAPLLLVSEIRTIEADDLWMSPCYHRPSTGFHFTWKQDWESVKKLLPVIEGRLDPYEARPHWGKVFTMAPSRVRSHYEKLPDFQALLQEYDPDGKFRNAFLAKYIFAN